MMAGLSIGFGLCITRHKNRRKQKQAALRANDGVLLNGALQQDHSALMGGEDAESVPSDAEEQKSPPELTPSEIEAAGIAFQVSKIWADAEASLLNRRR